MLVLAAQKKMIYDLEIKSSGDITPIPHEDPELFPGPFYWYSGSNLTLIFSEWVEVDWKFLLGFIQLQKLAFYYQSSYSNSE